MKQTAPDAWTAPALNPLVPRQYPHCLSEPSVPFGVSSATVTGQGRLEKVLVEVLLVAGFIPLFQCWERAKCNCPLVPKDHICLAGVFKAFVWDT